MAKTAKPKGAASFFLSEFGKNLTKVAQGVNKYTKIGALVSAPIESYYAGKIQKHQAAEQASNQQFTNHLIDKLKQPNLSQSARQQIHNTLKDTIASQVKSAPQRIKDAQPETTGKDIASGALFLGSLALGGYNPGLNLVKGATGSLESGAMANLASQVGNSINTASKVSKYGKVIGSVLAHAPQIARDAASGTAFLASGDLAQGKNPNLKKDIGIGAGLALAGPLAGVAIKGAGLAAEKSGLSPAVRQGAENVLNALERTATRKVDEYGNVLPKTFSERAAQSALNTVNFIKDIPRRYLDPNQPFAALQNKIRAKVNGPLKPDELLYVNADRVGKLAPNVSQQQVEDFFGRYSGSGRLLQPGKQTEFQDIAPQVQQRIAIQEKINRVQNGKNVSGGVDFTKFRDGSKEYEAAKQAELSRLNQELLSHQTQNASIEPRINKAVQNFTDYNKQQLQLDVQSGLKSQEQADALLKSNPTYYRHDIPELSDAGVTGYGNASTKQVSNSGLQKATGSSRAVETPYNSMVDNTLKMNVLRERNVFANQLVSAQEKYNIVPGMTRYTGTKPPGENSFTFFRNGEKETWIIPKNQESLYKALTGVDNPTMSGLTSVISKVNNVFKGLATRFSPSFLTSNLPRDLQTKTLLMNSFIKEMTSLTGQNFVEYTPAEIDRLFRANRAMQSSLMREGKPSESIKSFMAPSIGKRILNVLNPVHAIEKLNDTLESATRKEVFRTALTNGLSPKVAGYISDAVTTDFSKIAPGLRELNQVIPFLNPRVQGAVNLAKGFSIDPVGVMRNMVLTAGYPTLVLDKWNRQFPSYDKIPTQEKDNYWVIMIKDEKNPSGNLVPDYFKIRKGEGQALFANTLRYALERGTSLDRRKGGQAASDIIGSVSPFNTGQGILSLVTGGNPLANIVVGLASNKNPYSGATIVPESLKNARPGLQSTTSTNKTLTDLGRKYNLSPVQAEFVLNSLGAGSAKDILSAVDAARSLSSTGKIQTNAPTSSAFGQMSKLPITRSFIGQQSGQLSPQNVYDKSVLQKIEQGNISKTIESKQTAQSIYDQMKSLGSADKVNEFIAQNKNLFTPELKKEIAAIKVKEKTAEDSMSFLSSVTDSASRAQFIEWKLWTLAKTPGVTKEDVNVYIKNLTDNGFITPKVKELIKQLQAKRK